MSWPENHKSVLDEPLCVCSTSPMTGFVRNGCCETGPQDPGSHTVCVEVTAGFLKFSKSRGNDLSTPIPDFEFPGLKPGDRWCLCAAHWQEDLAADAAPPVSSVSAWPCGYSEADTKSCCSTAQSRTWALPAAMPASSPITAASRSTAPPCSTTLPSLLWSRESPLRLDPFHALRLGPTPQTA